MRTKETELEKLRSTKETEIEEIRNNLQHQIDDKSKFIHEMNNDAAQQCLRLNNLQKEIDDLKNIIANKDEEIKNLLEKTTGIVPLLSFTYIKFIKLNKIITWKGISILFIKINKFS